MKTPQRPNTGIAAAPPSIQGLMSIICDLDKELEVLKEAVTAMQSKLEVVMLPPCDNEANPCRPPHSGSQAVCNLVSIEDKVISLQKQIGYITRMLNV